MGKLPALPMSLMFSTPEGRDGWDGKGRTRVWIEDGWWVERRGFRIGRFFGVTRMVMVMPRRASWWARSSMGNMWP